MTNYSLNSAKRLFVAAKIRTFPVPNWNALNDSLNGIQSPINKQNHLYYVSNKLKFNELAVQNSK